MGTIRDFNPWLFLPDKALTPPPLTSWWLEHPHSVEDWYLRAKSEAPRMAASPEARTIMPRCLDDIK